MEITGSPGSLTDYDFKLPNNHLNWINSMGQTFPAIRAKTLHIIAHEFSNSLVFLCPR